MERVKTKGEELEHILKTVPKWHSDLQTSVQQVSMYVYNHCSVQKLYSLASNTTHNTILSTCGKYPQRFLGQWTVVG